MKYLLDTCVLLWALQGDVAKLGRFSSIIQNEKNIIIVSVVSYWEIVIKQSVGKLEIPDHFLTEIEALGFLWMNMELKHVDTLKTLPLIHHDPFDRLLIAQSLADDLCLLTYDQKILQYELRT
ncbi:MAG: type II toxin-antitoxin system VapC family toxin [Gammaproteobacteria bacterium]|nr:type II toxin-antitoxin system VapC family toxin [Gammaproteobacteria bacterium]